jgi:predicted adenylyl cyclase CyaB
MSRNIEIKARVTDRAGLLERAARLAHSAPTLIEQDDTFFTCSNGRLKLRAFPGGDGELIFYRRADTQGPKTSFYEIAPVPDAARLREVLAMAHSVAGRVVKQRTLFLVGRTRVHVDQVADLGDWMELEVVLQNGDDEAAGRQEAQSLMQALGIPETALAEGAYVDLLRLQVAPSPSA